MIGTRDDAVTRGVGNIERANTLGPSWLSPDVGFTPPDQR
jgi:hypothetical protein